MKGRGGTVYLCDTHRDDTKKENAMMNNIGPRWYIRETFADRFRQWKITAFLCAVILSGLVQFGWQALTRTGDE